MTSIDRRFLANYLRQQDPRSPISAQLELAKPPRFTADGLDEAIPRNVDCPRGSGCSVLESVRDILRAPSLYDFAELRLPELKALTQVEGSKRRNKKAKKPQVPAFSSLTAPRIAQTAPSNDIHSAWSSYIGSYCTGMPVLSPDGDHLYIFNQSGTFSSLNRRTGTQEWSLSLGQQGYSTPSVSPDGKTVYVAGGYGKCSLWALDVEAKAIKWEISPSSNNYNSQCMSPSLSPDGKYLYLPCIDGNLYKFDTETGEQLGSLYLGSSLAAYYGAPCISPDGSRIVAREGINVYVVDTETMQKQWSTAVDGTSNGGPIFSEDGNTVYVPGTYNMYAFDVNEQKQLWSSAVSLGGGNQTPVLSRDGSRLYIGDNAGALHVFDTADGTQTVSISSSANYTMQGGVALNHDESIVYGVDTYGRFYAFDVEDQTSQLIIQAQQTYGGFVMSPDGRFAYLAGNGGQNAQAVQLVS